MDRNHSRHAVDQLEWHQTQVRILPTPRPTRFNRFERDRDGCNGSRYWWGGDCWPTGPGGCDWYPPSATIAFLVNRSDPAHRFDRLGGARYHCSRAPSPVRPLFEFWLKIIGMAFGLGIVSGIVMAFDDESLPKKAGWRPLFSYRLAR
jgi:hypothetical protein